MQVDHLDNEISIVPFKYKYMTMLLEMLEDRNYPHIASISMKSLPKIGYIAIMNKQPIAAGFLRMVEGGYAQMDTLVSNPYFGSIIRNEGIVKVVDSILSDAKDLKLIGIIAFTEDLGVLKRAEVLGFTKVEQSIITLRL